MNFLRKLISGWKRKDWTISAWSKSDQELDAEMGRERKPDDKRGNKTFLGIQFNRKF